MEHSKVNIIKIAIGTSISLAALYLLYKFTSGKDTASSASRKARTSKDEFSEVID